MAPFVRKPAQGSRQALLAAAVGVAFWGAAMAAQAGDPPAPQPQQPPANTQGSAAPSSAPAAKPAAKPDPDDRVVCREEETTGTRLGTKRVCMTLREWKQIARDSQDMLDDWSHHEPPPNAPGPK